MNAQHWHYREDMKSPPERGRVTDIAIKAWLRGGANNTPIELRAEFLIRGIGRRGMACRALLVAGHIVAAKRPPRSSPQFKK